jgi:hypothetical protein
MTLSGAQIAEIAGSPTAAFTPRDGKLSTLFDWFGDADRLCVIARDPAMKPQDCDTGFSHALGHLGDRDLTVVFPEAGARAVADRLPFLEVPVRAFVLVTRASRCFNHCDPPTSSPATGGSEAARMT